MPVNCWVGASPTYASDLATMSHSEITIQTSNLMSTNANGNSGGGGGGGGGGDTPIVPSESAADLTNKVCIDTSKMKEEEPSSSPTGGGEGGGNDAGGGQPGLTQDSLSLMQLKRLVVEAPRLKVCLIDLSFCFAPHRRVCGNQSIGLLPFKLGGWAFYWQQARSVRTFEYQFGVDAQIRTENQPYIFLNPVFGYFLPVAQGPLPLLPPPV